MFRRGRRGDGRERRSHAPTVRRVHTLLRGKLRLPVQAGKLASLNRAWQSIEGKFRACINEYACTESVAFACTCTPWQTTRRPPLPLPAFALEPPYLHCRHRQWPTAFKTTPGHQGLHCPTPSRRRRHRRLPLGPAPGPTWARMGGGTRRRRASVLGPRRHQHDTGHSLSSRARRANPQAA